VHGVWNFFALLSGLGSSFDFFSNSPLSTLSNLAPWVLGLLFIVMLALLFLMNQKIRSASALPPSIPPLPLETIG
jgi:hypothetical protein